MEAKLEKIENSEAYISITVDEEMVELGMEQAYRKVVKQVNIPGFRKGKAPRQLLEAYYSKEVLYQEALEYIVPESYNKALEELNITPVAQPDFEIDELEAGQPMTYSIRVAVKPEVTLGRLENIEVKIPKMAIGDEDVERQLQTIRERYSIVEEKLDQPAGWSDSLVMDFVGYVDDKEFEGGSATNYVLELGSNTFIPGFEERLVGVKKGETRDINVTFPDDYQSQELAGADARFNVTVHKVEAKKLRDLDDELAQEISEFDTIDEFREDLKDNMLNMLENRKKELVKQEVIDQAVAECEITVAEPMLKEQMERMKEQFIRTISRQGLTLEQYYQFTGSSEEELAENMRPEAERSIKVNLMLEKIADEKGIIVTDEEINQQIEDVAASMGVEAEQVRQNMAGSIDEIIFSMKFDKAADYLINHAVIIETDPGDDEHEDVEDNSEDNEANNGEDKEE